MDLFCDLRGKQILHKLTMWGPLLNIDYFLMSTAYTHLRRYCIKKLLHSPHCVTGIL